MIPWVLPSEKRRHILLGSVEQLLRVSLDPQNPDLSHVRRTTWQLQDQWQRICTKDGLGGCELDGRRVQQLGRGRRKGAVLAMQY